MTSEPASERVRVRRVAERGDYDPGTVNAILDEALIAHVGVGTSRGPIVLPMLFGRTDATLYLHGAVGNDLLRQADGTEVCVTVTLLDGLVIARSAFHHSMNYRSVVVRGLARRITDDRELDLAFRLMTDRVGAGRYDDCRVPDAAEIKKTAVMAVPLSEASAKIRSGDPIDDDADLDSGFWAGVVPLRTVRGAPQAAGDLPADVPVPGYL
ncbi:MAG: pyridoxamine 5'-phosphate oxidase family protein [Acidimicrobiales bacterium]